MLPCRLVARRPVKRKRPGRPPKHAPKEGHAPEDRFPGARVIKRYGNRRLYDASRSRAITMDGVAELVRAGENVRVIDGDSGEDVTRRVLTQILLEDESRRALELLPVELLQKMIALRNDAVGQWMTQYFEAAARFLDRQWTQAGADAMFPWLKPGAWTPPPPAAEKPPKPDDRLELELEELQRRMADLSAKMKQR
jgi:polyhydroxyalkanoate synthesis repressor PhaR